MKKKWMFIEGKFFCPDCGGHFDKQYERCPRCASNLEYSDDVPNNQGLWCLTVAVSWDDWRTQKTLNVLHFSDWETAARSAREYVFEILSTTGPGKVSVMIPDVIGWGKDETSCIEVHHLYDNGVRRYIISKE